IELHRFMRPDIGIRHLRRHAKIPPQSAFTTTSAFNVQAQKNPLDGGFKLCDEVTTLNSITNFLRT
ncbi:hypothetical protein A8M46_22715, partial [Escherichia coli]